MTSAFMPAVERRHPIIGQCRSELALFDRHRDAREQHEQVRHLALVGESEVSTSVVVGVTDRTVHRIRHREPADDYRPPLPEPDVSDERIAELEGAAELALHLALLLRDEDPNLVWAILSRLSRRQLQEMLVIALATVRPDATAAELFDWVEDLPAARQETAHGL